MATVRPFKAIRPKTELAEKIASVPYDVVTKEEAVELAADNPLSFLHVIRPEIDLPEGTDLYSEVVYEKARENFNALISSGRLISEEKASFYIYRLESKARSQIGIAGCSSVEDYDKGIIKKHEVTRKAKEDDRVRHMLALSAHAGPVLLTFRKTEELARIINLEIEKPPLYDFTAEDGVRHTVWRTEDPRPIEKAFDTIPALYIADGHHRAAGASRVRAEMLKKQENPGTEDEAWNYFLTVAFPSDQLTIFPYDRYILPAAVKENGAFLREVEKRFDLKRNSEKAAGSKELKKEPEEKGEICMYLEGTWYTLREKTPGPGTNSSWDPVGALDLSVFQRTLLEPVLEIKDQRNDKRIDFVGGSGSAEKLENMVDSRGGAAFTFYPVLLEELLAVADAGMIMPPKSTWFEPKLRSGLLVHGF
jgi:uncharacterized protein (DUF1015 family)